MATFFLLLIILLNDQGLTVPVTKTNLSFSIATVLVDNGCKRAY